MKVSVKKLEHSHVEVTVTVEGNIWLDAQKKAMKKIQADVSVPGFRKGHVPEKIILQKYGQDMINAYAQEEAVNSTYGEAVMQEKLQVIEQPHNLEIVSTEPFSYKVTVAVLPEVTIGDEYKTMKVKKEKVEITEKELETAISDLKKRLTGFIESDEASKKGDKLTIDFEGFDPETTQPLEGTTSKGANCVLGENMYVPGFEDALIGAKKGETKEFEVTFPADYFHEPFKNKKVKFVVTVQKVEQSQEPELNEEFIEKLTGKKSTPEDFTKELHERLLKEKQDAERNRQEDAYLDEAVKKYVVTEDLPHTLVDQEMEYMLSQWKEQIASQGMRPEEYLMHVQKTEDDLKHEWHEDAHKRAAKRFILSKLLEKAQIEVTDADIEAEVEKLAARFENPDHKARLKEIYANKEQARAQMGARLQIQKFFDEILA